MRSSTSISSRPGGGRRSAFLLPRCFRGSVGWHNPKSSSLFSLWIFSAGAELPTDPKSGRDQTMISFRSSEPPRTCLRLGRVSALYGNGPKSSRRRETAAG